MCGFSSSPVGLLSLMRSFASFHLAQHDRCGLYIEGLITINEKILSLFIYDSFTLEVSSLSRWFTLQYSFFPGNNFPSSPGDAVSDPIPPSVSVLWLVCHSCSSALSLAIGGPSCTVPSSQEWTFLVDDETEEILNSNIRLVQYNSRPSLLQQLGVQMPS